MNAGLNCTFPRWLALLARRYVAWTERAVKGELLEMRLTDLEHWRPAPLPAEVTILPLSVCGSELLLRRVFNEASQDGPGFRRARYIDIVAFAAASNHDRNGIFLARVGKRYVGTCVGRCRQDRTGGIYSLSVRGEFRRRGIGRALLQAAIAYLRERSVTEVRLYVHPRNHTAMALYREEGFQLVPSSRG